MIRASNQGEVPRFIGLLAEAAVSVESLDLIEYFYVYSLDRFMESIEVKLC